MFNEEDVIPYEPDPEAAARAMEAVKQMMEERKPHYSGPSLIEKYGKADGYTPLRQRFQQGKV